MNQQQLWAPWRLGYIKGEAKAPAPDPATEPAQSLAEEPESGPAWLPGADRQCFICRAVFAETTMFAETAVAAETTVAEAAGDMAAAAAGLPAAADRRNLVVHRGAHTITILNRYPYNNGHLLVATRRHKGRLDELSSEEHLDSMQAISRHIGLLERRMNAEGFNVGLNLGKVAGAGLPGHLHWHVVPRWNGDTNFMPALAGIKVIPQSLEALWELLTSERD